MKSQNYPLISIIIPVYNAEKHVKRCVESVLAQTYQNIEIILIDDGSTDNSGNICDELCLNSNKIRVFHQKNAGQASARNVGINMAQGTIVGFVDDDDVVVPTMYEVLYRNKVQYNVEISGTVANWVYPDRIECAGKKYESRFYTSEELILNMFYKKNLISSSVWDKIFDISLFNDIKFPAGSEYEDYWVISQMLLKVAGIYISTEPLYNWYQYSSSQSKLGFHEKSKTYIEIPKKIRMEYIRRECDNRIIKSIDNFVLIGYIKFFGKIFQSDVISMKREIIEAYRRELKKELYNAFGNKKISWNVKFKCIILISPFFRIYGKLWKMKNGNTKMY